MRRGIFGGTFNPPHLGHRKALEDFIELAELDKCSVFPTGTPPHKIYQREISDKHRFELVRLAFSDIAEPDDYEMKKSGKSYTVETLDYLRKIYPEDRLFLFMGSDMFLNFENVWYRYEDIINYTTVVCLSRTGEDFGLLEEHELRLRKLYSAERCV